MTTSHRISLHLASGAIDAEIHVAHSNQTFSDDVQIFRAKQTHQYLITMRSVVTRDQMCTFNH